jgi:putative membrane protein
VIAGLALTAALLAYAGAAARLRRRGDRWPPLRDLCWAAGVLALVRPVYAQHGTFVDHVAGHLLLASVAPVFLALAAPVTLALRTLPPTPRRRLTGLLRGPLPRVLGHPVTVILLNPVALAVLYLTPLYARTQHDPGLHLAVHAHMFAAGCLLAWYLVGVDPMRHRPSARARLTVLFVVAGAHDVLAKVLYAQLRPLGGGTPDDLRAGAQLLYYGGDAVEIALAVIVLGAWYRRAGLRAARAPAGPAAARAGSRRPAAAAPAGPPAAAAGRTPPAG